MREDSEVVQVTFDCEVYFRREIDTAYGEDADGRRGIRLVEDIPTHVEIHQVVPEAVAGFIKTCAIDQFIASRRR